MPSKLNADIMYIPGIGERKAQVLASEVGVRTYDDLIHYYPYKHVDRTRIYRTDELTSEMPYVQLQGIIISFVIEGTARKKRLKALFADKYGTIELVWFNSITYIQKSLKTHKTYTIFGKPTYFNGSYSIAHPEIESADTPNSSVGILYPIYTVTEKMKRAGITSKDISTYIRHAFKSLKGHIMETLPEYIVSHYKMLGREEAMYYMHFPTDAVMLERASLRMKTDELFYIRLRMRWYHHQRQKEGGGYSFAKVGERFLQLYHEGLTFDLTDAQKRVVREIREDTISGHQMNRLLQGDVGSGKTIVALLSMLLAVDNGMQASIMAPTEILAQQHYVSISQLLSGQPTTCALLTGSMKAKEKKKVLEAVEAGEVDILIGTHILIQEYVKFRNLGMVVIDEQHRFGVYQRSVLWQKSDGSINPHILVMSATPIPRTLAMTMYGDLDVSVLDELPPGRTPIQTRHFLEDKQGEVFTFMHEQLHQGRQCYVVFPMIEERDDIDILSLEAGFEDFKAAFPYAQVGMVHGKMKPEDKEEEMQKFVRGETKILVATTVIEVGVNVPNATVMVIKNADRFGLSQLHQLRGRVGRGSDQSYCILMTDNSLSQNSLRRILIMCESTDGFYIAEEDLKLRGQGDIDGTAQSGTGSLLKLADLSKDTRLVIFVSRLVDYILDEDHDLSAFKNEIIRTELQKILSVNVDWSKIS